MPFVTINGLSHRTGVVLQELRDDVALVISEVEAFKLTPSQVTVTFPFDLCVKGNDVIVSVFIYEKQGRASVDFKKMATDLVKFLKEKYFQDSLVEVNTILLNPRNCSSSADL